MPTFTATTHSGKQVSIAYEPLRSMRKSNGYATLRERRARNYRVLIVRNAVERAGVIISPLHKVRRIHGRYVFTIEESGENFSLPSLGYVHNSSWKELRNIWIKVLADTMAMRDDLTWIRGALGRLEPQFNDLALDVGILKDDVGTLKSDMSFVKGAVETLASDVTVVKSDITALTANMVTVKTDVAKISTKLETFSLETRESLISLANVADKILSVVQP